MTARKGLQEHEGVVRCLWCGTDDTYRCYHDEEWGRPVGDDRRLFEKVCLETFQSGLSWLTILKKRASFRRAFLDFDFRRVAALGPADVERLLEDATIVRHRAKIEATIHNARRALDLRGDSGSLAAYFWGFEPSPRDRPRRMTYAASRKLTRTSASTALSEDLRRRGWKWVGPTTCYAFLQSMGLVNDHLEGCHVRDGIERKRARLTPP